nr:hypothetical protein [Klebsiella pneumoniae]
MSTGSGSVYPPALRMSTGSGPAYPPALRIRGLTLSGTKTHVKGFWS